MVMYIWNIYPFGHLYSYLEMNNKRYVTRVSNIESNFKQFQDSK